MCFEWRWEAEDRKTSKVRRVFSLGAVQDRTRKRRKKRRSGRQSLREWEREMIPSWLGSKDTAWWSERSQETAGQKESKREQRGKQRTERHQRK